MNLSKIAPISDSQNGAQLLYIQIKFLFVAQWDKIYEAWNSDIQLFIVCITVVLDIIITDRIE